MDKKDFSWAVVGISCDDYIAFSSWITNHHDLLEHKKLIIWGAGSRGSIFAWVLEKYGIDDFIFADSNPSLWGGKVNGADIISPSNLSFYKDRLILVSPENSGEIEEFLNEHGYLGDHDYFIIETKTYDKFMKEFLRDYRRNYLVLGSCEFDMISIFDSEYNSVKDMLFDCLGADSTKILSVHGLGMRAHYNLFQLQLARGMRPQNLILQINVDTLVAKDHLRPHTQHVELFKRLMDLQENPSEEFLQYFEAASARSKNPLMKPFESLESKERFPKVKIRNFLRYYFMSELDCDAEGLVYLGKILDLAAKENVKVLPFIWPVNYQLGREVFQEEFDIKYQNNIRKIEKIVQKRNISILDLSYSLDSKLFAWPEAPNASLGIQGRQMIAGMLAQAIKTIS